MPGLSLFYTSDEALGPTAHAWERAISATRCETPSSQRTLFRDRCCWIGSSEYPGYPLESKESDDAFVCLEGRVYSADPAATLDELLGVTVGNVDGVSASLRSHAREWDGDFVALLYAKQSQRLWIATDPMGRLPLYARASGRALLASRDQRFLLELIERRAPDRIAIAQLLLFGFPIGTRTLTEGVERLPPGRLLAVGRDLVKTEPLEETAIQLEDKARASFSAKRNAADLGDLFTGICRTRADAVAPAVLALSGGLDSRAVGAALTRASVPFEAATFVDSSGVYEKEVEVARAVAATLGAPWKVLRVPAPRGDRLQRLLRVKTGLNTLAMAFSLDFFDMVRAGYGARVSFWSGDGGDKLLPDHRPRLTTAQRADFVRYLIEKDHVWPLELVVRMTGLGEREVVDSVRNVIESYSERSADYKYVRFLISERGYRWILEGEDTNRHYYWTVSPFDALAVVRAAMACPEGQKSGHHLYRLFMRNLNPAVTRVADANLGIAMSSPLYAWNRRARALSRRFPRLQRWLRPGRETSVLQPGRALYRDLLIRQAESSTAVRECFTPGELREVADRVERWSPHAVECLLTATSAVEEIVERRTVLDGFTEATFG